MSLARSKLADIQAIPATVGSMYANPASTKSYIRGLIIYNGNVTDEVVEIYNVPDLATVLGTPGATNRFLKVTLTPDETFSPSWEYPITLTDENDSIQAVTTTGSLVTLQLLGDSE